MVHGPYRQLCLQIPWSDLDVVVELSEKSFNTYGDMPIFLHADSIRSIIRYSVSSPPSMHASHWSNSGVPCSLQKYLWHRLQVIKVILTRSSASHRSHWPALRALGIALSPRQVEWFLNRHVPDLARTAGRGPHPPHSSVYTDTTSVLAAPIQNRPALVVRVRSSLRP